MGHLNLALLGTPEIQHGGQAVTLPTRKALALLIYLAVLDLSREDEPGTKSAIVYLQEALNLAESIGLPGEQWSILAKLAELYSLTGDEDQAGQALAQAKEIIQALAAKIEDEGLRAEFLAAKLGGLV